MARLLHSIVIVLFAFIASAHAQDYPTRTVSLVVPYPPGWRC